MFYELRQYRTQPGQRENWVKFMEEVIIPFQVSKGMVITGGFVGEEEDDLYVWIRRFESEKEREELIKKRFQLEKEWAQHIRFLRAHNNVILAENLRILGNADDIAQFKLIRQLEKKGLGSGSETETASSSKP